MVLRRLGPWGDVGDWETTRNKGTKLTLCRFVNVLFFETRSAAMLYLVLWLRKAVVPKLYNNIPKAITKVSPPEELCPSQITRAHFPLANSSLLYVHDRIGSYKIIILHLFICSSFAFHMNKCIITIIKTTIIVNIKMYCFIQACKYIILLFYNIVIIYTLHI